MDSARIAELLAPFLDDASTQQLTTADLEHISTYIDILLRWNARINLTAVRDPDEIVTRHFGESLFAAHVLFPNRHNAGTVGPPPERGSAETPTQTEHEGLQRELNAKTDRGGRAALQGRAEGERMKGALAPEITLADVGSGAGFPGIPIKLWQPRLSLTLIESNHKKATFLREMARALALTDTNILTTRAESLTTTAFDIVTLRAVERFESILPVAARLVAPRGRLALLIGAPQLPVAESIIGPIPGFDSPHFTTHAVPLARSRVLAIAQGSPSPHS